MTGRRPDTTKCWNFLDSFREEGVGKDWTSLPEHFKNHGYFTTGAGKLFHPGVPPNFDQPYSWSTNFPYLDLGSNATNLNKTLCNDSHFCVEYVKKGTYLQDTRNTLEILDRLEYAAKHQPFFVGLGIHKPHLPWTFPAEFWEMYAGETIPPAKHRNFPEGAPPIAFHSPAAFNQRFLPVGDNHHSYTDAYESLMRKAYHAASSYCDSLIGIVLNKLEELGLANETVVSFIGDHGWQLGEHDEWCKMTNFELGVRIPMIFRAPWKTQSTGKVTEALAEAVDLFPTLSELAGLPPPTDKTPLEGTSLAPLFDNPSDSSLKPVALSQFPRCWQNNTHHAKDQFDGPGDEKNRTNSIENMSDCHWTDRAYLDFMGYSMRTDKFRYTEWTKWDGEKLRPIWTENYGTELYDHRDDDGTDMDAHENVNLAHKAEYADLVKKLSTMLHQEVEKYWKD